MLAWALFAASAFAQDLDNDGCNDVEYAQNGACVDTTSTVGSGVVGTGAQIGPYVELVGSVMIAPRASVAGSTSTTPRTIADGTVIGRQARIGRDATIGANNTFGRAAQVGDRLASQSGVWVGSGATIGDDITLRYSAVVGNLVSVGDFTTVGTSAVLSRGVTIASSFSTKRANILGVVGPEVSAGRGVQMAASARVRKRASLGNDAVIEDNVRIGRDVQVQDGAIVGAGAVVGAGATILSDVTVPDGFRVPRGTTYAGEPSADCDLGLGGLECDVPLCTLCVDGDATAAGSGECWSDPSSDLKATLDAALTAPHQAACPSGVSVWVAEGTYTPSVSDRQASFVLDSGVSLFGGFAGSETQLSQRDIAGNPTVLSGDLNRDDTPNFGARTDNATTVVTFDNADGSAVLDGVTVQAGYADIASGQSGRGGGVYINRGSAVLTHLTVRDNAAKTTSGGYYGGGGIYANHASLTLSNSTFEGNTANAMASYAGGGALYAFGESHVAIDGVTFQGNTTPSGGGSYRGGGAIFARSASGSPMGSMTIRNSTFLGNNGGNSAHHYAGGGAMLIQSLPLDVVNSVFSGNAVGNVGRGGAAYVMFAESSEPCNDQWEQCLDDTGYDFDTCDDELFQCTDMGVLLTPHSFTNCTFNANSANEGGALYFFQTAGVSSAEPTDTVVNSVFGSNPGTDTIGHQSADVGVTYSCLSDWSGGGTGNLNACTPTFIDADGSDNTIGTTGDNVRLTSGSSGVNAGLNSAPGLSGVTTDIDGAARLNGTVDMGAYELP